MAGNVGPLEVDVECWWCVVTIVRGELKRVKSVDQVGDSGGSVDDGPVWEGGLETDFPQGCDETGQRVSITHRAARYGGECGCCHIEVIDVVALEICFKLDGVDRLKSRWLITERHQKVLVDETHQTTIQRAQSEHHRHVGEWRVVVGLARRIVAESSR